MSHHKRSACRLLATATKDHAQAATNVFAANYGTKWPKAAAKVTDDLDVYRPSTTTLPSTGSTCARTGPVVAVGVPHHVTLVRAGAVFKNGKLIKRPDGSEGGDQQVA